MSAHEDRVIRAYRFLAAYWNAVLAAIAVFGVAVFAVVPQLQKYRDFFVFIGLNAVVWSLVEIKAKLLPEARSKKLGDMRDARPHILESIKRAMTRSRATPLRVTIVGGRIRTISDMLREIRYDIEQKEITPHNVSFAIYCLHPDFVVLSVN